MVDTKSPGDKTLSVPSKTLTLKPRVETGTVRQSFSHGRTKQVVVEKRGKRRIGGDAPATATHAPEPVVAKAAPAKPPLARPAARPARRAAGSGVVLRTLTEDERSARASALADAKVARRRRAPAGRRRSQAPQQQGRHRAGRARSRRSPPQGRGRTPPPGRGSQAQGRTRSQEAFWRSRGQGRDGDARPLRDPPRRPPGDRPAAACRPRARPALPPTAPTRTKVRARSAAAPAAPRALWRRPRPPHKPAPAEAARPPDAGHRAQCRRRARALDRLVPPPHPAPEGPCLERAEGKAHPRGDDPGSDHHPGTRQPHGRARGRRHPHADEAGRDAQDHRRDRCRHRAADRRGTGPHRQARRRVRRRGRPVRRRRRFHRHRAALAGRDRDGPRRPRQDLAARRAAPRQRGLRRSRRHHPAYRRLSGDLAGKRQEDHLHRYARPRRVHRDARARRQGHRHRRAGGRGR